MPETKVEEVNSEREARGVVPETVPFVVQPGFKAPDGVRGGRFMISFGTSTSITTSTTTYLVILTATCKSTTAFSPCSGFTGK